VLRGSDASDTQFCKKANEADIVHISTHGFFTGTIHSTDLSPAITDNSLSESGLAMAGVNANLHNNAFDATHYDGILTAKELSEQNFSNIKMIVLSACQTGLGYITGDGVYGLQRGLKAAGVGAMTLSLWSVDDYATCELMQRFYAELLKPGATDIYHSFMQARKSLMTDKAITSYKFSAAKLALKANNLNFNKPQYTNAFILIDVL
jgi:CHAT domain-containing protein